MAKKTKTQPKARKAITSNNLADLSKLVQALEIDDENPCLLYTSPSPRDA